MFRGVPAQDDPLVGVTTYVTVIGEVVRLVNTSFIWIVPAAPIGTFTPAVAGPAPSGSGQLNTVPAGRLAGVNNIEYATLLPVQIVFAWGVTSTGRGLTVITTVRGVPAHKPPTDGVMV